MKENSDLHKTLETTLGRVTDWLKFAETKNAALLAFCSAIVTAVSTRLAAPEYAEVKLGLYILLGAAVFGGIVALSSFLPVLERTFFSLAVIRERPATNLLFFADIARLKPEDYLAKIADSYGHLSPKNESKNESAARDLADQIVHISRIAVRKFWMFNLAAMPLLVSLIATTVLMIWPK